MDPEVRLEALQLFAERVAPLLRGWTRRQTAAGAGTVPDMIAGRIVISDTI
jgi:hypothetical protein